MKNLLATLFLTCYCVFNNSYARFVEQDTVINNIDKTITIVRDVTFNANQDEDGNTIPNNTENYIIFNVPDGYTLVVGENVEFDIQKTDTEKQYVEIIGDMKLLSGASFIVRREAYFTLYGSLTVEGTGSTIKVEDPGHISKSSYFLVTGDFNNNTSPGGNTTIDIDHKGSLFIMGDATGGNSTLTLAIRNGDETGIGGIHVDGDENIDDFHDYNKKSDGTFPSALNSKIQSVNDLPVELIDFTASVIGDQVIVSWSTATELNADYFDLQKSNDKVNWESLERISAQGNSTHVTNYEYIDTDPLNGDFYYRLIQYDFDGKNETFGPIHINNRINAERFNVSVYPNPSTSITRLDVNRVDLNAIIKVSIYDSNGKLVGEKELSVGQYNFTFNLDTMIKLNKGVYYLTFQQGKFIEKKKVIRY
ncbi:T9SS type A sorting domain-containing protein [Flammeovirga sp. SubArs3]|uniref:T9SS type A sorting domain-containing protein n=1 Tax=Flammeovirga sp. SubArs3 TaxID=2995316 RepID=UPI00248C8F9B|nr:T9SS type A sorting domain-containing protein [Flammeovirga sp. SubArs3]